MKTMNEYSLVVVMPVYEDEEASSRLFYELSAEFNKDVYIVVVDDGSVKSPVNVDHLNNAGAEGVVLTLKRNVGHQKAIAIGLGYVAEHINENQKIVVMDSDGEDLPSTIHELLAVLNSESVDVVVAQRKSRVETLKFKAFYSVYKRIFSALTGRNISFGNFMALKPFSVKRLVSMQEISIHVAASVIASKLRTEGCSLDRGPRYAGQSKMNFVGLALHGFKGLMVFAEDVLVRVGIACALIAAFSVICAILAIILKTIGFSTPGWFSVAMGILMLMFMQTGALALMSLMMTGVVRSGNVTPLIVYHDFIDKVNYTKS